MRAAELPVITEARAEQAYPQFLWISLLISSSSVLPDIIQSRKAPTIEESISNHPTVKPQQLLRILVRSLLPLGEGKILDPFCGSGSTIAACQAVGYDAIDVEVDEEYLALHRNNTAQYIAIAIDSKVKQWVVCSNHFGVDRERQA